MRRTPLPPPPPKRRSIVPLTLLTATLLALSVAAMASGRGGKAKPNRTSLATPSGTPPMSKARERRLTIFYTSAIQGTLEPCGCNSDPLGGIDRYAAVVRAAQKQGPVLVVDGGNTLFSAHGLPQQKRDAAKLRAQFLAEQLKRLGLAASALGMADLAAGPDNVALARLAVNAEGKLVQAAQLHKVGDIQVGLLGVVDADVADAAHLKADDPVEAATREAQRLRAQGADLVVAVAAVDRPTARKLARKADIDFLVLGVASEEGMADPDAVGGTFIVGAAAELQKAGRIDVVLRPSDSKGLINAGSPQTQAAVRLDVEKKMASLNVQIEQWQADPGTDKAFLAAKQQELAALRSERTALAQPWKPPTTGSYFANTLIPIRRALPQDKQVTAAMRKLDQAIGKINLAAAVPPPKAEPTRPHFVGDKDCGRCHKQAMAFWKTTVHAHAWKTLVDGGKHADLECVGCHVTGYGQVGGSALGFTKGLENVQCEVCHNPGSMHVAEEGLEEPALVRSQTPESTCLQCHNEKHSDTFNFEAYLRDILGPGHGEAARKRLGNGPTGGELRRAAMARAQAAGQAQAKGL